MSSYLDPRGATILVIVCLPVFPGLSPPWIGKDIIRITCILPLGLWLHGDQGNQTFVYKSKLLYWKMSVISFSLNNCSTNVSESFLTGRSSILNTQKDARLTMYLLWIVMQIKMTRRKLMAFNQNTLKRFVDILEIILQSK